MGADVDPKEVLDFFDDMLKVGTNALEFMSMDFWEISTEKANIDKGTLRGSIQADKISDYQWIIGTNLEYAQSVHDGYAAHWIYGSAGPSYMGQSITGKKGMLYWPGAKHPVLRVHHPGYKGNPFFDDSLEIIENQLDDYVGMAMKAIT
jgi:hypothetical protein